MEPAPVLWEGPSASHRIRRASRRGFDGNHSDEISQWLFAGEDFVALSDEGLWELVMATSSGHLSWVLVDPRGYRL